MAVRFSAVGDYLGRAADLPQLDPFSFSVWVCLDVDLNAAGDICIMTDAVESFVTVGIGDDGTTLRIVTDNGESTGSELTIGTYAHLGFVHDGTTLTLYLNGNSDIVRSPDAITLTPGAIALASNTVTNYISGRLAYWKCWEAALTQSEIQQEMRTIRPHRTADLYSWTPMFPGAAERTLDYSGNGRDWTEAGTVEDEDPPPVSWGAPIQIFAAIATAGGAAETGFMTLRARYWGT